ncbi:MULTISPECIES: DUF58 domain-containing protein [unclassified Enterococcus]|uniref:DUF58 domain-containing protein n=1 Tax=unclassified Enterococcus TaxID=2608891 RepID=UPI0013EAF6BA|nr:MULTISPECIES: DUF58 domain-containing protein [unclassified Enterococcus]
MTKIKDYFINAVLIFVYFIVVFFALVFNNALGWFLLTFFTLYIIWSFASLTSLLKNIIFASSIVPLVHRQKKTKATLQIAKHGSFTLPLPRLQVDFPENFVEPKKDLLILTRKKQELALYWKPLQRGCETKLTLHLTAYDCLGLFRKSFRKEIDFTTTTLPGLRMQQAEKLQRILQKKQQLAHCQRGMDFREHRPYRQGDAFSRINWKLSARHQEWLYREYEFQKEEAAPLICFWGAEGPKFEQTFDVYFSFWRLISKENPDLLLLGDRPFYGKDPSFTEFATFSPGNELFFPEYLEKHQAKHLVIFAPSASAMLLQNISVLQKRASVCLVYFEKDELVIREKEKIVPISGGERFDA